MSDLNTPIKPEIVKVDKQSKTQIYVVYRKPTLNTKTEIS